MKIAIVTGFAGFIGSHFTELLLKQGWFVHGIDKLTRVSNSEIVSQLENAYPKNFKYQLQDINDLEHLPDCDVIFNFAAESDVDSSNEDSSIFVKSNVQGVQNLLRLVNSSKLLKVNKPLFFQVSTDEVYGDTAYGYFKETDTLNPSNPYAATKAAADLLILSWARTYGLNYIIVRPTNNYGSRQFPEKLIPLAVKQLARGHKIKLHNQGTPIRTWLHVLDTVEAMLFIYSTGKVNEIYNISSYESQTNLETVKTIINSYFDCEVDIKKHLDANYNRPGQDIRYALDCSKLKKLGWAASRTLDIELPKLVSEIKNNIIW